MFFQKLYGMSGDEKLKEIITKLEIEYFLDQKTKKITKKIL
jgi:hypothetical protein